MSNANVGSIPGGASRLFEAVITVDDGTGGRDLLLRLPTLADQPATGADLYRLLSRAAGRQLPLLTLERTGELLARNVSLINAGLISGDRLTAAPPRPEASPQSEVASRNPDRITLRTLTGPHPGVELHVPPGDTIGRSSSEALDDPSVSRQQFRFNVVGGAVTVEDRGAVNPTVVNGRTAVPRVPIEVASGDVIEAGSVSLAFVSGPPLRRDIHDRSFIYNGGSLGFLQAPRVIDPEPGPLSESPIPPDEPPERRFPLAAAVLPVVLGAVMAVVLAPVYALFVLVSPLMVVWTYLDDRRSGRRAYTRALAAHHQDVAVHRLAAADYADQVAAWRRRRTPSLTRIAGWVRIGAQELWSRRPEHDDFLTVAIGQADRSVGADGSSPVGPGAAELRADARSVVAPRPGVDAESAMERSAPVTLDLGATPIVGVTGQPGAAAGVASAITAQLVGLRSPKDLQLFVLAPSWENSWSWTTWLPHASAPLNAGYGQRAGAEGVPDSLIRPINVAGTDEEAKTLFRHLETVLADRKERASTQLGSTVEQPRIVVVVQPPVALAPAALSAFLGDAGNHGFSVLTLAVDRVQLPAEVAVHVEAGDLESGLEVTNLSTGEVERQIRPWFLDPARADALARDLAPLVDLNAAAASNEVPVSVGFQQANGLVLPGTTVVIDPPPANTVTPDSLAMRWRADRRGLQTVVGVAESGPVVLDLKGDGPHGLVAGTTGSGKSEFLQAMLAGLAFNYSPWDVNFILIDYKGGAAFRQCRLLPHTVGFVTDLDDRLAERALVSLRAELRRREEVLAAAGVSDLEQMAQTYRHGPDERTVPASLVVVIDEFAALKSEVPDFVDGLVDIAQRGRSMGVHMVLATQKPAGVITPQIDANTTIRVALRVANEHESSDIIGESVAAEITSDRPGRAFLKIGGGSRVTEFQSTFVGGPVLGEGLSQPSLFSVGYCSGASRLELPSEKEEGQSSGLDDGCSVAGELEIVVALAEAAWAKLGGDTGPILDQARQVGADQHHVGSELHRPWLPQLPAVVALPDLLFVDPPAGRDGHQHADASKEVRRVALGLLDLPHRQTQVPMMLDLAACGHVAVYGTSGSGKSTLLRALACSLTAESADAGTSGPDVVVVDGAGSLADLADLPLVSDVIPATDVERVGLLVDHLRTRMATAQTEQVDRSLIVLIDGFGSFWSTLQSIQFGRAADDFARLLGDMPGLGIHVVMTADQRSAVPHQCLAAVGLRLVQRMTSADDYRALDIRVPPSTAAMPPGRTLVVGLVDQVVEMQTAVPVLSRARGGGSITSAEQIDAVNLLSADSTRLLRSAGIAAREPTLLGLPDVVTLDDSMMQVRSGSPSWGSIPIGLGRGRKPVELNFADNATLLIVGPPQSGRTSTLVTLLGQLALLRQSTGIGVEHRIVAPRRSSALAERPEAVTSGFSSTLQAWADELTERTEKIVAGAEIDPILVVIDDADALFDDPAASAPLTELVLNGRDGAIAVAASAASFRTAQAYETWIRALRSAGHGLVLQPDGDRDEDIFDCRFPRGEPTAFPVGRGYLIERSVVRLVQVGLSESMS